MENKLKVDVAFQLEVNGKLAVRVYPCGRVEMPEWVTADDVIRAMAWTALGGGFRRMNTEPVDFERDGLNDAVLALWPAPEGGYRYDKAEVAY